jgi:hypothetical protein
MQLSDLHFPRRLDLCNESISRYMTRQVESHVPVMTTSCGRTEPFRTSAHISTNSSSMSMCGGTSLNMATVRVRSRTPSAAQHGDYGPSMSPSAGSPAWADRSFISARARSFPLL